MNVFWYIEHRIQEFYFWARMWCQRIFRGYADVECWNLFYYLAEYALPRLRSLRENCHGHPAQLTAEEWDTILGKMIYAMNIIANDDYILQFDWEKQEDLDRYRAEALLVQEGCELFGKYFQNLWD
jgi:hypothetical protein